ncbi:Protein phosphatase methylesterase 1 [Naganishia albida]|nr:Protein phosphatase methylesterase 1 [Naganishia albida]
MSDIFRKSVLNRLPAMPPTKAPSKLTRTGPQDLTAFSPISPASYFTQALEIDPPSRNITFRAYYTPSSISSDAAQTTGKRSRGSVLVCHHGGGLAGTTFACLAKSVRECSRGELGVLAFDARDHGKTRTDPEEDSRVVSFDNLQQDFIALIKQVFPDANGAPDLLLLGHSMGASPVVSSTPLLQKDGYKVVGVIVLDVVEGTAVEALPLMKNILSQRPTKFNSVEEAIQWHISSGAVRNLESARVSVPALLVPLPNRKEESHEVVWRTDLVATAPYWEEWYLHLSSSFLSARAAKLLVLAGQERLDRELMVGQMQGKFQLEVLPDVGHYLHEDKPEKLAAVIVDFWKRNTTTLVLPPKIGSAPAAQAVKMVGEE